MKGGRVVSRPLIKAPLHKSDTRVGGLGVNGGELLVEGCGYCNGDCVDSEVGTDELVGWGGGVAS